MGFLTSLIGARQVRWREALAYVQTKFTVFRSLLDQQNQVLKAISVLEEKSRDRRPPNPACLAGIQEGIRDLIDKMIELGGEQYEVLRQRYEAILAELETGVGAKPRVASSDFVVPFDRLGPIGAHVVGTKNANLGELKSRLGLPVPDGFAITTGAYRHFVAANQLQERISALLEPLSNDGEKGDTPHLAEGVTAEIRSLILSSPIPEDLRVAIRTSYEELARRRPEARFAMRSSAIDEDSTFTFAGQYVSFLNVRKDELLECYKRVLASQFTPAALSYLMASAPSGYLAASDLAMGVGCMEVVDAVASGVIYTRDPLKGDSEYAVVNAVFGLGSYLVEGTLTPDVFHVSRKDGGAQFSRLARKPVQLVMLPEGGVGQRPVPESDQQQASVAAPTLRALVEYALKIEAHYGVPQDVEWAIDRRGRLFLLQTRPLRVIQPKAISPAPPELEGQRLAAKGTPVCPGAGGGPVFHVRSMADLGSVPEGVVLVAQNPSPKLIAVMRRLSALVTEVGGVASHMATLAREAGLPTVAGVAGAGELPSGLTVTVDATEGNLYEGLHGELIACRRRECEAIAVGRIPESLRRIMRPIAHLNLINPGAPDFRAESCRTFHDIIRFIHQKAIEEMFLAATRTGYKDRIGRRLKTSVPLVVNIIQLEPDAGPPGRKAKSWIADDEVDCIPMKAFWSGVLEEGWPSPPAAPDLKGFLAVMGTNIGQGNRAEFSESSYAFVSREYMLLNLRMGYHFATIEALVTPDPIKNYIRMQYKEGGAPLDRRVRRIRLISDLLTRIGFEHSSEGDFLDAVLSYQDAPAMARHLQLVGRINIITKQLDMALANDAVAQWYTEDFMKKLGLGDSAADRHHDSLQRRSRELRP